MDRWAGKVALVTDANVAIGAAIVTELAKNGMKVIAIVRKINKLQQVAASIKRDLNIDIYPRQCDLQIEEDILKVFQWAQQQLGSVDVLVNNVAVVSTEPSIEGSSTTYHNTIDTNVIATAICSREFVKSIKERNSSGHIINISSMVSHDAETSNVPLSLYTASKFAINGMSSSLRTELTNANLDIKVTNISPGAVQTDMLLNVYPQAEEKNLPVLNAKDIANTVVYVLRMPQDVQICDVIVQPHNAPSNIS